jgi:SpoVK/Ycf46/Vps4 family AAA+-type ATPase
LIRFLIIYSKPDGNNAVTDFEFSDNVKQLLINGAFIYLAKPELTKYIANLSPQSKKMLLCGAHGTELYQEALAKALCKHFNASLFILDSSHLDSETADEDKEEEDATETKTKTTGGTTIPKFKKGISVIFIVN